MVQPFHAVVAALRRLEYLVLLPFVFCATWVEASPPETRDAVLRGIGSAAMMVAGLSGVTIIRAFYT
jgi:hypothetical protein